MLRNQVFVHRVKAINSCNSLNGLPFRKSTVKLNYSIFLLTNQSFSLRNFHVLMISFDNLKSPIVRTISTQVFLKIHYNRLLQEINKLPANSSRATKSSQLILPHGIQFNIRKLIYSSVQQIRQLLSNKTSRTAFSERTTNSNIPR